MSKDAPGPLFVRLSDRHCFTREQFRVLLGVKSPGMISGWAHGELAPALHYITLFGAKTGEPPEVLWPVVESGIRSGNYTADAVQIELGLYTAARKSLPYSVAPIVVKAEGDCVNGRPLRAFADAETALGLLENFIDLDKTSCESLSLVPYAYEWKIRAHRVRLRCLQEMWVEGSCIQAQREIDAIRFSLNHLKRLGVQRAFYEADVPFQTTLVAYQEGMLRVARRESDTLQLQDVTEVEKIANDLFKLGAQTEGFRLLRAIGSEYACRRPDGEWERIQRQLNGRAARVKDERRQVADYFFALEATVRFLLYAGYPEAAFRASDDLIADYEKWKARSGGQGVTSVETSLHSARVILIARHWKKLDHSSDAKLVVEQALSVTKALDCSVKTQNNVRVLSNCLDADHPLTAFAQDYSGNRSHCSTA